MTDSLIDWSSEVSGGVVYADNIMRRVTTHMAHTVRTDYLIKRTNINGHFLVLRSK